MKPRPTQWTVWDIIFEEFFPSLSKTIDLSPHYDKPITLEVDDILTQDLGLSQGYFLRLQDTINKQLK